MIPTQVAFNLAEFNIGVHTSDGNWLSFTKRDDVQNAEIFVLDMREVNVTRNPFNDTRGIIIATGSYNLNGGTIRTLGSLVITYDPTRLNNYRVNIENLGVPPDVWVKNTT